MTRAGQNINSFFERKQVDVLTLRGLYEFVTSEKERTLEDVASTNQRMALNTVVRFRKSGSIKHQISLFGVDAAERRAFHALPQQGCEPACPRPHT